MRVVLLLELTLAIMTEVTFGCFPNTDPPQTSGILTIRRFLKVNICFSFKSQWWR